MRIHSLSPLVACLALVSSEALAADLYVDASAPGGGDGSMQSPWDNLQAALDVVTPGDIVHVAAGTYVGEHSTTSSGDPDARIEVVADTPGTAIVQADGGRALRAQHPWYTFRGLVFDGAYGDRDVIAGDGGEHLQLIDVEVRRSGRDCVDLGTSKDVLIERANIHHCVANDGQGVIDGHGVTADSVFGLTIRDSEISLCSGDGLQISPPRQPWDDVLVENTDIWLGELDEDAGPIAAGTLMGENAVDTKVADGELPHLVMRNVRVWGYDNGYISNQAAFNIKESVNCELDRVTVFDSEQAFRLRAPATVTVDNALVYSVDVAFRLEDGIASPRLRHVTAGAGINQILTDAGGAPQGLEILNMLVLGELPAEASDPSNLATDASAFVDVGAHDYHLLVGSAPVDAGVTLVEVSADRDGVPRPTGPSSDVGAYEWTDEPPPGDGDGDPTGDGDGDPTGDGDGDPTGDGDGDGGSDGEGSTDGTGESGDPPSVPGAGCSCQADPGPLDSELAIALALLTLAGIGLRRPKASGPARK